MSEVRWRSIRSWAWVFVLYRLVLEENHSVLLIEDSLAKAVGFGESVPSLVTQVVYLLVLPWTRIRIF